MNRRRRFLLASVLAVQNSSFIYPSCQRCFSRIVLDSQRFTCPRCGSSGEADSASYRYRLSLKVAESSRLCVITVFGSCLDTFFGLTATGLKRYLEDSGETPEALDSGGRQSLLTTAVENCFIGQSFVFGVTNFGDVCEHDSDPSNFLQPCCQHKGEVRTLVASQMVLPSPHLTGFTVIDYLNHLLHSSNLKKQHCDSRECSSHLLTLDHSDSDLSSRHSSEKTSCFLEESCGRDDFLRFWQPSLELTSTDSEVTANDDFSALEQAMVSGTPNQDRQYISFSKATGSKNCHNPLQSSQSPVSYMDKNNTTGKLGGELGLQADHLSPVWPSFRETRLSDSNSLFPPQIQDPFEEDNAESYSEAAIKSEYSQDDIPCYQHRDINTTSILQERSAFSLSSLRPKETPSASQSLVWDDLPFSESLNKFLAVVENEIAITETDPKDRTQVIDNGINKFHTDHSRLSMTPRRNTGALNALPLCLRSSPAMTKENSRKETFFSNCESNASPQIEKESKLNKTAEPVPMGSDGSDISEWFLDTCLSALFTSPKDMEASVTQKRTLQQRDEISLRPSTSTGDCSHLRNKCNGCGEKSCSNSKGKLASLCSKKHSDLSYLHKLENKQYYRWSKNQDDNFTICRKLTYPLETLCSSPRNINTVKEIPHRPINSNLTQSFSADHEGSYNASADLFDDVAKNKDIGTEITKMSQDVLLPWEASCSENCAVDENCSHASQKLPLQNISMSRCPRAGSQSDSESDFSESQDFVPCSQSTPVAGFHRRIHGLHGTFKILPSLYSNLSANYKKKISPENDKRQVTSAFPKNVKTPSQKSKSPVVSGLRQAEINHCPTAEGLESDGDEWVPPTTQKVFLSDTLGFKAMCLRKCLAVHYSPDQKELPRKKLIKVAHKSNMFKIKS